MTDYPVFKNAPITESLLDIQVLRSPSTDLSALELVQEKVLNRYPKRKDRKHWEIKAVELEGAEPSLSQSGETVGFIFFPGQERPDRALQARLDGFSFSKLRPYESWEPFRKEAMELWQIFAGVTQPVRVQRLGLRTINSLRLPLPFNDFKEYLLTGPDVAPGIPGGLSQFYMQLNVPQPGGEIATIISSLEAQQIDADSVTVIFDIDVYIAEVFQPQADEIWQKFEVLRQIRNRIFFNSLTDKAKELF
jgi:uncharacterized protein (TIGR04255 family)